MFKSIITIIFLLATLGIFFFFINPTYKDIKDLKGKEKSYQEALVNSRELERITASLRDSYQSFQADDVKKLNTLLPDYVNNVQLAVEIEKLALSYGMFLKNVTHKLPQEDATGRQLTREQLAEQKKDYGVFELSFSTEGAYNNFVNFLSDLEKSLRIVDIESISFSVVESPGALQVSNNYKYDLKIKTYWLKNK